MKKLLLLAFGLVGASILSTSGAQAFGFEHKTTHVLTSVQGTDINEDAVGDMVVDGNRLYIGTGNANTPNFEVIDITDPTSPRTETILTDAMLGASAVQEDFTVKDGYLYLVGFQELVVYDVRDITNPVETARIADVNVKGGKPVIYDDTMYIKSYSGANLSIFDVSNRATPSFLGRIFDDAGLFLGGDGGIFNKVGDYLYLTQDIVSTYIGETLTFFEPGGIQVIDVSDPTNPVAPTSLTAPGVPATYQGGLYVLTAWDDRSAHDEKMLAVGVEGDFVDIVFNADGSLDITRGAKANGQMHPILETPDGVFLATRLASNVPELGGIHTYNRKDATEMSALYTAGATDYPSLVSIVDAYHVNGHYIALIDGTRNGFGVSQIEVFSTADHVYRFWSESFKAHFYTSSLLERESLMANDPNWVYEGATYETYPIGSTGSATVYRFWSPVYQNHFFTTAQIERDHLIANDPNWSYEGEAYTVRFAFLTGYTEVYRFWSPVYEGHFYTPSGLEKDSIIANDPNWIYEGISWYVKE